MYGYGRLVKIQTQEILIRARKDIDSVAISCCIVLNERNAIATRPKKILFEEEYDIAIRLYETKAVLVAYNILKRHFKRIKHYEQ